MMFTPSAKVALITGASSGIGLHLARSFALSGHDLIVTGSDRPRLRAAAEQIYRDVPGARVDLVIADLARPQGARDLYEAAGSFQRPIDVLVNNAGVGLWGGFATRTDLAAELAMIQLNTMSLTVLTKLVARDMVARATGRILVTACAVAAGHPGFATVYDATKAFARSFADGLRKEMRGTGVTVTTLRAGATDTDLFRRGGAVPAPGPLADPAEVAQAAHDGLLRGDDQVAVAMPGDDGERPHGTLWPTAGFSPISNERADDGRDGAGSS